MGQTTIGTSNAQTKKLFAGALFNDAIFRILLGFDLHGSRLQRAAPQHPMQLVTDLEKDDGDTVNYDLYVQLKGRPTLEDDNLEGNAGLCAPTATASPSPRSVTPLTLAAA